MNWRRTGILAAYDLRYSVLRLKGLVFLIPFTFFWYWLIKSLLDNSARHLVTTEGLAVTAMLFNPEIAQTLLILHPPSLSVFFIAVLSTAPFFVMLGANNQLAGDAGRQTFRYYLTRCTRSELFFGRFISSYLLVAAAIIIVAVITTLISLYHDDHGNPETIAYAMQVTFLTLAYILPFVAYMAMVSSFMGSALSTLLVAVAMYFILLILTTYINHYLPVEMSLLPSGIKHHLFNINPQDLYYALGGSLCYTLIYGMIGWWLFQRRNI